MSSSEQEYWLENVYDSESLEFEEERYILKEKGEGYVLIDVEDPKRDRLELKDKTELDKVKNFLEESSDKNPPYLDRYAYLETFDEFVVYDRENHKAWIQSSESVEVVE